MVWPLQASPLGGNLGATTCSIFQLDPTGTTALEPIVDLIPGLTPMRVTFDMVDQESAVFEYDVTEHAIQDFLSIASHIAKRLESISITGTLGATLPLVGALPLPPVPGSMARIDLLRVKHLKMMADRRLPIMIVTPRVGLARAAITSITQNWTPADAESTVVSMVIRELRLVSPIGGDLVSVDEAASTSGNTSSSGGGQAATSSAGGSSASYPSAVGPPA
jgi:hypothetical protein